MRARTLREEADAAETLRAQQAQRRGPVPPVAETDLGEVMDVSEVDEYVAATGEYPLSTDLADGEVAEDSLLDDVVGPDAALGDMEQEVAAPTVRERVVAGSGAIVRERERTVPG